jgi:hypothetical protein
LYWSQAKRSMLSKRMLFSASAVGIYDPLRTYPGVGARLVVVQFAGTGSCVGPPARTLRFAVGIAFIKNSMFTARDSTIKGSLKTVFSSSSMVR